MLSDYAVREAKVIVREGVGRIVVDNHAMTSNSLAVVFHPEEIVGQRIADLLVLGTGFGAGTGGGRRLEDRPDRKRDRGKQENARPGKAQWFNRSRSRSE